MINDIRRKAWTLRMSHNLLNSPLLHDVWQFAEERKTKTLSWNTLRVLCEFLNDSHNHSRWLFFFLSWKYKWAIVKGQYLPNTNSSAKFPPCINSDSTHRRCGSEAISLRWHCTQKKDHFFSVHLLLKWFVFSSQVYTLASVLYTEWKKLLQMFFLSLVKGAWKFWVTLQIKTRSPSNHWCFWNQTNYFHIYYIDILQS